MDCKAIKEQVSKKRARTTSNDSVAAISFTTKCEVDGCDCCPRVVECPMCTEEIYAGFGNELLELNYIQHLFDEHGGWGFTEIRLTKKRSVTPPPTVCVSSVDVPDGFEHLTAKQVGISFGVCDVDSTCKCHGKQRSNENHYYCLRCGFYVCAVSNELEYNELLCEHYCRCRNLRGRNENNVRRTLVNNGIFTAESGRARRHRRISDRSARGYIQRITNLILHGLDYDTLMDIYFRECLGGHCCDHIDPTTARSTELGKPHVVCYLCEEVIMFGEAQVEHTPMMLAHMLIEHEDMLWGLERDPTTFNSQSPYVFVPCAKGCRMKHRHVTQDMAPRLNTMMKKAGKLKRAIRKAANMKGVFTAEAGEGWFSTTHNLGDKTLDAVQELTQGLSLLAEKLPRPNEAQTIVREVGTTVTNSLASSASAFTLMVGFAFCAFKAATQSENKMWLYATVSLGGVILFTATAVGLRDIIKQIIQYFRDKTTQPSAFKAESGNDIYELIVSAVSLFLTTTFTKQKFSLTTLVKESLPDLKKIREGLSFGITEVIGIFEKLVNIIRREVLQRGGIHFFDTNRTELDCWIKECEILEDTHRQGNLKINMSNANRIDQILSRGRSLKAKLLDTKSDFRLTGAVDTWLHIMNKINDGFEQSGMRHAMLRVEPVCAFLIGPPGTGKSTANSAIHRGFCARCLPEEQIETFKKYPDSVVYWVTGGCKHFDGLTGCQFITHWDDAFQERDMVGREPNPIVNFIHMKGNTPFKAPMASLSQKGNTFYWAAGIFLSANTREIRLESIHDPGAVKRRFDFTFFTVPKLEFCKQTDETGLWSRKLDPHKVKYPIRYDAKGEPELDESKGDDVVGFVRDIYEFHEAIWEDKDNEAKPTGRIFSYDEVMDALVAKQQWFARKYEAMVRDLDQYTNEELAKRFKSEGGPIPEATIKGLLAGEAPTLELHHNEEDNMTLVDILAFVKEHEMGHCGTPTASSYINFPPRSVIDEKELDKVLKFYNSLDVVQRQVFDEQMSTMLSMQARSYCDFAPAEMEKNFHGTPFYKYVRNAWWYRYKRYMLEATDRGFDAVMGVVEYFKINGFKKAVEEGYTHTKSAREKIYNGYVHLRDKAKSYLQRFYSWVKSFFEDDPIFGMCMWLPLVTAFFQTFAWFKRWMWPAQPEQGNWFDDSDSDSFGGESVAKPKKKFIKLKKLETSKVAFSAEAIDTSSQDLLRKVFANSTYIVNFAEDFTEDSTLAELIKQNPDKAVLEQVGVVTFLRERVAIMPAHFKDVIRRYLKVGYRADGCVRLTRATNYNIYYDVPISTLMNALPITDTENRDVCMFEAPRNVLSHIDLTTRFVPLDYVSNKKTFQVTVPFIRDSMTYCYSGRATHQDAVKYGVQDEVREYRRGYMYQCESRSGDCGSMLFLNDNHSGAPKILGMHVAGNGNGMGYATSLTREDIENGLKQFKFVIQHDPVAEKAFMAESIKGPADDAFIGLFELENPVCRASKSKIRKSPLYEAWGPAKKAPAVLTPRMRDGVLIDPMTIAQKKYAKSQPYIDEKLLRAAADGLFSDLDRAALKLGVVADRRLLTREEAIKGIEGSEYLAPLNRHTSPGYPYSMQPRRGLKGKTRFFGREGDFDFESEDCKKLFEELDQDEDDLAHGVRPEWYVVDCMKDEERKLSKVESLSTRLFGNKNFRSIIAARRYFGTFFEWYLSMKVHNECAAGVNVYSKEECDLIADMFIAKGGRGTFTDYKDYDADLKAQQSWVLFDKVDDWYDDEYTLQRTIIFLTTINSRHIVGVIVYQWDHGLPSGDAFTMGWNSLVNSMNFRIVYIIVHDWDYSAVRHFQEHVFLIVLGDDNATAIHPAKQDIFNMRTMIDVMKRVGYTLTDELKSEGEIVPIRDFREGEFLKRKLRYDDELGRYVMPWNLEALMESPYWSKEGPYYEQIVDDKIQNTLCELSLHGREVFEVNAKKVLRACRARSVPIPPMVDFDVCRDFILHSELKL